jgi:para-nitrobenzyl esterase
MIHSAGKEGIVKVRSGFLSGISEKGGKITAFKGVPYAAPPVGALRWRPPQPPVPWDGVRPADRFGPAAMQHLSSPGNFFRREFLSQPFEQSEDCLFLNIWTPAASPEDKLPVFFWIHGGGMEWWSGSSIPFDGANLAELGVVVVTINYRLGLFGLLAHPHLSRESPQGVSGNYAILDQIAAMKWVRENIAGFGGDPDNVTLGGESGGSRGIAIHLVSPLSKGLFHRVVMQSGSAVGGWNLDIKLEEGEKSGLGFAEMLGAGTLDELRAMSARDLLAYYIPSKIGNKRAFTYIDGYVLNAEPGRIFQDGGEYKVPILNGNTKNEGTHDYSNVTAAGYEEGIRLRYGADADAYLSCYPGRTGEEAIASMSAASSDQFFVGHRLMSYFHHKGTGEPVYQYLFTKIPPGRESGHYGAFHTGEIAYIFRNLDFIDRPWTEGDYAFSEQIARYWINFIKEGNPNGLSLPPWEICTDRDSPVMLLGDKTGMVPVPNRERMSFVSGRYSAWLENRNARLSL